MGILAVGWAAVALQARIDAPHRLLERGIRCKDRQQWANAERLFRRVVTTAPQSGRAEHAQYYLGIVSYLQHRWEDARGAFDWLVTHFPDSRMAAESYYHLALCDEALGRREDMRQALDTLTNEFPQTSWAQAARQRWPNGP